MSNKGVAWYSDTLWKKYLLLAKRGKSDDECWIVPPSPNGNRRTATYKRKKTLIYRIVYQEYVGEIPDGMVVMHAVCDNPNCCNPRHLLIGTQADNIRDAANKGRMSSPRPSAQGERNHAAKLTSEIARQVKQTPPSADAARALAAKYGVSSTAIRRIWTGNSWRHIPWAE